MQNEHDDVLIRFQLGCVAAFETLFRQHERAVYGWALRIVRDRVAAEDVTVETFWRIYRAHARFDAGRGFEPWARRIATRAALDWMRGERPGGAMAAVEMDELAAPAAGDAAVQWEMRTKTAEAFARLPAKLRIAAVLSVVEELPGKDVAEALGITVAAVKLRVFRALRLLRRDLEEQGMKP